MAALAARLQRSGVSVWSIGALIIAALVLTPIDPV